nr:hypothetical protein Iba_chr07bCG5760 [Ipomoea batatas]GMD29679.1 hypothetical protein Iba_scaffold1222050CG0010 [Ipomoea batatas]GME00619.1 hypothetical protein Iba_scaffold453032CG0010 [Ipomoea batatas]
MAVIKDATVIKLLRSIVEQHNIQIPTTAAAAVEFQPPPPQSNFNPASANLRSATSHR